MEHKKRFTHHTTGAYERVTRLVTNGNFYPERSLMVIPEDHSMCNDRIVCSRHNQSHSTKLNDQRGSM